jgi:hypothetical protein
MRNSEPRTDRHAALLLLLQRHREDHTQSKVVFPRAREALASREPISGNETVVKPIWEILP